MTGRLGIYVDAVYRIAEKKGGREISTDRAFVLFACEVGKRFDRLVLFGRTLHSSEQAEYLLPAQTGLVELPHYTSLLRLGEVALAAPRTLLAMWRGLEQVDIVWVIGPNPFDAILIPLALLRRKRLALGVRQDTVAYYRARAPSRLWAPAVGAMRAIDLLYRLLARRVRTTVVGTGIAGRYGLSRSTVLPITVSLIREAEIATALPGRDWSGRIELLTVGRIEPEKNPLLLVETLARLGRDSPGRFRLIWVGRGALERVVRDAARRLGVAEEIEFHGYVPFGPQLFELYRRAHLFVHVSLTEGIPQVIVEALACGTPVVATDVGGVRDAVDDGRAALLVPPRDRDALAAAVQRLVLDAALRQQLARRGLELARKTTVEAEAERVAQFIGEPAASTGGPSSTPSEAESQRATGRRGASVGRAGERPEARR